MRRLFSHRPSPATVIAAAALFIALGGTSYSAVSKLTPRNTVGSAQVINGSLQKSDLSKKAVAALRGNRGAAKHPTTSGCGHILFTLPVGYRPATGLGFAVYRQDEGTTSEGTRVNVDDVGSVFLVNCTNGGAATGILALDGIVFRTA